MLSNTPPTTFIECVDTEEEIDFVESLINENE
jgi:hypothetical protein